MSKSILIIDTPKCCKECWFLVQDEATGIWWCREGFIVRHLHEKSDMCPLKEVDDE